MGESGAVQPRVPRDESVGLWSETYTGEGDAPGGVPGPRRPRYTSPCRQGHQGRSGRLIEIVPLEPDPADTGEGSAARATFRRLRSLRVTPGSIPR
jgi:hypothetical protein